MTKFYWPKLYLKSLHLKNSFHLQLLYITTFGKPTQGQ